MKIITLILTVVFAAAMTADIYAGNNEKVSVSVPTIQCGTCKKNITTALKNIDGVSKVVVDMKKKTANIIYDDSKTNLEALENAITAAGYDANDKKADPVAYEKLDECCKVKNPK